jgi:deazaflavin-dependent oxidoreductase (nitroreductase family)
MADNARDRITNFFQKRVANPMMRRNPMQTLLETTGRKSGEPRRTPLGGSRVGDQFWFVSEFGEKSQYVKNIHANPSVRVRLRGRWHNGTAHLVPDDDPSHGCATCRSSTASGYARSARTCSRSASI